MPTLTPKQCKAARALKGWVQEDLAKESGVGVGSVGKFENGDFTRDSMIDDIYHAFLKCGVEFLDNNGVRLRDDFAYIYRAANSYDKFLEDIFKDVERTKCDVVAFFKSQDGLIRPSGETRRNNLDRLNLLSEKTKVRCLVADVQLPSYVVPQFEMRNVPKQALAPSSFVVFGDKLAKIYLEAGYYNICVHRIASLAIDYKNSFTFAWDGARQIQIEPVPVKRHVSLVVTGQL